MNSCTVLKPNIFNGERYTHPSLQYLTLALLSFLLAWYFMGGFAIDFKIPLIYGGDGLFTSWIIKRLMDGVWYFNNNASGFPFGSNFLDYPASDVGNFFILKLLGLMTGNYAVTLNLYYLLSFPTTALVSFYVLRQFSVSVLLSWAGALIFTFLPFHFLRLPHLLYTWYFVVPLFALFSLRVFSSHPFFFDQAVTWRSKLKDICILLLLSSFGVYYAFFGILMLLFSGALASIRFKSKKNLASACIAVFIVSAGVGANLAPNLVNRIEYGANPEVAHRIPFESELYGLKISQLLIWRPEHRLLNLVHPHRGYNPKTAFLSAGNLDALGMVASVGLLILCALCLIQRNKDPRLYLLSSLLVFLLLFATIDGFSALFALWVTPMIRAWGRISIVLGFISIVGLMIVLDHYFHQAGRFHFSSRPTFICAITLLIIFALWDQTAPSCHSCLKETQRAFMNDEKFVHGITQLMPVDAAIYQLPYMPFPETPPVHHLGDYELFRGYLHSSHLKWSYGGMKGRPGDLFFRALSKKPISDQVSEIKRMGFEGIYIDRRGYEDHGAALEASLSNITGGPPALVSEDGELVFFVL